MTGKATAKGLSVSVTFSELSITTPSGGGVTSYVDASGVGMPWVRAERTLIGCSTTRAENNYVKGLTAAGAYWQPTSVKMGTDALNDSSVIVIKSSLEHFMGDFK